jgi:hypothetical protein
VASESATLHTPPARLSSRLRSRIRSWLHALELDRQLAGGAHPRQSAELRLRAERLGRTRTRFQLAKALRWVVNEADGYASVHVPAAEQRAGHAVRLNSDRLGALADRLEARPPHRLRGLAMVSHLIHDAESPLHDGQPPASLANAIQRAHAALDD